MIDSRSTSSAPEVLRPSPAPQQDGASQSGATERHRRGRWLTLPLATGAIVFFVNNVLLARLLTSLPGGTPLAITNMAALAILVPRLRAFGTVTLVYLAYVTLGTLGHLGVDAGVYVLHLPRVLGAALAFDVVLLFGRFRWWALALGVLPFAILLIGSALSPREWVVALSLAYAGLGAGMLTQLRRARTRA